MRLRATGVLVGLAAVALAGATPAAASDKSAARVFVRGFAELERTGTKALNDHLERCFFTSRTPRCGRLLLGIERVRTQNRRLAARLRREGTSSPTGSRARSVALLGLRQIGRFLRLLAAAVPKDPGATDEQDLRRLSPAFRVAERSERNITKARRLFRRANAS